MKDPTQRSGITPTLCSRSPTSQGRSPTTAMCWACSSDGCGKGASGRTTEHSPIEIYFPRSARPSPSRLAVFVDDAEASYEKYRAAGAEIVDAPKPEAWGLRGFTVRDPDGKLIGIVQEVHSPVAALSIGT